MTTLTYLGNLEDYPEGEAPLDTGCTWGGYTFPLGVPVEVDDPDLIEKAHGNRYFRVDEPASGRVDYNQFLDQPLKPDPPKRSHHKKKVVTDDADH